MILGVFDVTERSGLNEKSVFVIPTYSAIGLALYPSTCDWTVFVGEGTNNYHHEANKMFIAHGTKAEFELLKLMYEGGSNNDET